MRLSNKTLSLFLNLLTGSAWALVAIGALSALTRTWHIGIFHALVSAFLWALPGLFLVVLLEYIHRGLERNEELRRQGELLRRIYDSLERRERK